MEKHQHFTRGARQFRLILPLQAFKNFTRMSVEGEGLQKKITLNDGHKMPLFGLGVYNAVGDDARQAVKFALQKGYRMIDTAALYGNEAEVGQAIKESGIQREDIFVVSKLWSKHHGYDECLQAFDASLKKLDIGYIDLYLIHTPTPGKNIDSYKALQKLKEEGVLR